MLARSCNPLVDPIAIVIKCLFRTAHVATSDSSQQIAPWVVFRIVPGIVDSCHGTVLGARLQNDKRRGGQATWVGSPRRGRCKHWRLRLLVVAVGCLAESREIQLYNHRSNPSNPSVVASSISQSWIAPDLLTPP